MTGTMKKNTQSTKAYLWLLFLCSICNANYYVFIIRTLGPCIELCNTVLTKCNYNIFQVGTTRTYGLAIPANAWVEAPRELNPGQWDTVFGCLLYSFQMMKNISIFTISRQMYNLVQWCYLIPAVKNVWQWCRSQWIQAVDCVDLAVDGRCDSMGHNAKHCTYGTMETASNKVLHPEIMQVHHIFPVTDLTAS